MLTFHCSIHLGNTKGDMPMNFGAAERARYKETIVPVFGDFLKKCYSKCLDCQSLRVLNLEQVLRNSKLGHSKSRTALHHSQPLTWSRGGYS